MAETAQWGAYAPGVAFWGLTCADSYPPLRVLVGALLGLSAALRDFSAVPRVTVPGDQCGAVRDEAPIQRDLLLYAVCMAKSKAAQRLLAALDEELAAASKAFGAELVWSAAEQQVRELLADAVDRRVELNGRYNSVEMVSLKLKIAAEIRLLDSAITRLLSQLSTEVAEPLSVTSRKAQAAARSRWDRERMRQRSNG